MIYIIDTVDLVKKYYKVDYEEIMTTNYIIIGSRVMITKNRKNVHNASNLFINTGMLRGVSFDVEQTSQEAFGQFKDYVLKHPSSLKFLCNIVESLILDGESTLLICSPNEMKIGYMQTIATLMYDLFRIPVCRYPKEELFDLKEVIQRLIIYTEAADRNLLRYVPEDQMIQEIKAMDRKKLKQELKHFNIFSNQETKKEMREDLIEFYKDARKSK